MTNGKCRHTRFAHGFRQPARPEGEGEGGPQLSAEASEVFPSSPVPPQNAMMAQCRDVARWERGAHGRKKIETELQGGKKEIERERRPTGQLRNPSSHPAEGLCIHRAMKAGQTRQQQDLLLVSPSSVFSTLEMVSAEAGRTLLSRSTPLSLATRNKMCPDLGNTGWCLRGLRRISHPRPRSQRGPRIRHPRAQGWEARSARHRHCKEANRQEGKSNEQADHCQGLVVPSTHTHEGDNVHTAEDARPVMR